MMIPGVCCNDQKLHVERTLKMENKTERIFSLLIENLAQKCICKQNNNKKTIVLSQLVCPLEKVK